MKPGCSKHFVLQKDAFSSIHPAFCSLWGLEEEASEAVCVDPCSSVLELLLSTGFLFVSYSPFSIACLQMKNWNQSETKVLQMQI